MRHAPDRLCRRRHEWTYVYGLVQPSTGRVEWLLLPTVNVELFQIALDIFTESTGACGERHVILVVDQPGWHMGMQLSVGENYWSRLRNPHAAAGTSARDTGAR